MVDGRQERARVVVVGDRPLPVQLLADVVGRDERFTLVGSAVSANLLPAGERHPVDVAVVLVGGPGWGLVDELWAMAARHPGARLIVVAAHVDGQVVQQVAACGAEVTTTDISVVDLLAWVDGRAPEPYRPSADVGLDRHGITRREGEILHLLADGVTPQQIAHRLGIATDTARDHLAALRRKLGCVTAVELVVHAHRLGLAPHVGRPVP